jgi:tetratricopeptide (TPR) repeat protein
MGETPMPLSNTPCHSPLKQQAVTRRVTKVRPKSGSSQNARPIAIKTVSPKSEKMRAKSEKTRQTREYTASRWYAMLASIAVGVGLVIACVVLLTPLEPVPTEPKSASIVVAKEPLSGRDPASPVDPKSGLPESDDDLTVEKLQSEMVQVATRLTTEFSTVSDALHVAAMTYAELKQTQNAEKVWRACIELKPTEVGPYVGLAANLIQRGQQDEAIKILDEIRKSKSSGELYCELAKALMDEGELGRAEEVLREGLAAYPSDPSLWLQQGLMESQLSRLDSAESALRKAIALGDGSRTTANAFLSVLLRQGRTDEAQKVREAISRVPTEPTEPAGSGSAESDTFQSTYISTLRALAVRLFRMAASVALNQKQSALAEEWLLRCVAIRPNALETYMDLSSLYRRENRIEDALKVQERLLQLQPQNVLNYINLASVAFQLGRYEQAEKVLVEATQVCPDEPFPFGELARINLAKRNFTAVRQLASKAIKIEPQNVEWYLMSAIAAEALGDAENYTSLLQQARRIAPNDPRLPPVVRPSSNP